MDHNDHLQRYHTANGNEWFIATPSQERELEELSESGSLEYDVDRRRVAGSFRPQFRITRKGN